MLTNSVLKVKLLLCLTSWRCIGTFKAPPILKFCSKGRQARGQKRLFLGPGTVA
jgi:hypothetical protein